MVLSVLLLMALLVAASIVELALVLYKEVTDATKGLLFLEINEFLKIFGFVFMVLIGFKLLDSITTYFKENVIHGEVVILIAVIAVSRKLISLDMEKYDPVSIIALGVIMLSLGASYFLLKRSNQARRLAWLKRVMVLPRRRKAGCYWRSCNDRVAYAPSRH